MEETLVTLPPPARVLHRFGLNFTPERLVGGEGRTFRVGEAIVKPVDDPSEAAYAAEVIERVEESSFRVSRPIAADDGSWVIDGWAAWTYLEGHYHGGRWEKVIRAGNDFNRALANLTPIPEAPRFLHPWTVGDRVAFGEFALHVPQPMQELVDLLGSRLRDLHRPEPQLIHGDLTANVILHDSLAPGIIDFTPYYRPLGYASAIVVNDAIVWHQADFNLTRLIPPEVDRYQLLARATIFRIVTSALYWASNSSQLAREATTYRPLVLSLVETMT